jgi:hypothetical protein
MRSCADLRCCAALTRHSGPGFGSAWSWSMRAERDNLHALTAVTDASAQRAESAAVLRRAIG